MMGEFIVGLLVLIFCASIGGLVLWKLFDLTRNSINKNKEPYDEKKFDRLAKAFIEHRKDTQKRLQNIEAIISAEDSISDSAKKQLDEFKTKQPESSQDRAPSDSERQPFSNHIPNMLNKNKQRAK